MITPRTSRLVRVADLHSFRHAIISLACEGAHLDARNRLVVVPTRAAAEQLVRSIETRSLSEGRVLVLPEFVLPGEMHQWLAERLPDPPLRLTAAERHVLLGVACRTARDSGIDPPFQLRPQLVAEILHFYDTLRRNGKDIDAFERLMLGKLQPDADHDRGAARLVAQTQFLIATFRCFERLCVDSGCSDEHVMRNRTLSVEAARPWRHVVIAVGDQGVDPYGLCPVDWDMVARLPGLERLDVVVTEATLAGAFHERLHQLLPGIEETRFEGEKHTPPSLVVRARESPDVGGPKGPNAGGPKGPPLLDGAWVARDREEEVAEFARWVRRAIRLGEVTHLDRVALVVCQPLPYVYTARDVLRSAGIACQTFDALPLAAEPFAAALDLVTTCVGTNFSRSAAIALLRSPHLRFARAVGGGRHELVTAREISSLDSALIEAGYLGDADALRSLIDSWQGGKAGGAGAVLLEAVRELLPLRSTAPPARHLEVLLAFLTAHEHVPGPDDPLRVRQLRARSAILGTLTSLLSAYGRFDSHQVAFDEVAALVRRSIESQTFAPRTGDSGVHLVDVASAKFGEFDAIYLAGLVDGEWPDRPRRNIFYSPALLRELGWPGESERLASARSTFRDLLRLPTARVIVSTFTLEQDSVVVPSTFLDELERSGLDTKEETRDTTRVFEYEALGLEPVELYGLTAAVRTWAERRLAKIQQDDRRFRGATSGYNSSSWSLSAIERYQDCPFKFFAADVLRLEEIPDDDTFSPRARGRFIHEVFQRFFEEWDRRGDRTITSDRVDEARTLFEALAEPLLARLSETDAALERSRLFGSAVTVGIVDVVLGLEASRSASVRERWLERRFHGEFALGTADGRRVSLNGVADRVDLLEGRALRVIDYKSGYPPAPQRALQVPIYALCAQEELLARDGHLWQVQEAAYVAFSGKRALVPVVRRDDDDGESILSAARTRLLSAIDGIERGEFPPRPHDPAICNYCSFASVCRKDYVGDDAPQ